MVPSAYPNVTTVLVAPNHRAPITGPVRIILSALSLQWDYTPPKCVCQVPSTVFCMNFMYNIVKQMCSKMLRGFCTAIPIVFRFLRKNPRKSAPGLGLAGWPRYAICVYLRNLRILFLRARP